jgi:alpha-galactosidase
MARIVFIGAGSTVFARNLMGDILSFPELSSSTIVLHDINEERLRTSEIVGHKIIETLGVRQLLIDVRLWLVRTMSSRCFKLVGTSHQL